MIKSDIDVLGLKDLKISKNLDLTSAGDFIKTGLGSEENGLLPYVETNADGSSGFIVNPIMTAQTGYLEVQPTDTTDTGSVNSGYSYLSPASITPDDSLIKSFWVRRGTTNATGNVNIKVYECDASGNITTGLDEAVVDFTWSKDDWNNAVDPEATVNNTMQVKAGQNYLNIWTISGNGVFSLKGDTPSPAIAGPNNFSPWFALDFRTLRKKRIFADSGEYFPKCSFDIRSLQGSTTFNNGDMVGVLFTPQQMGRFNKWQILLNQNNFQVSDSGIVRVGLYRWDFADFNNPTFVKVDGSVDFMTITAGDPKGVLDFTLSNYYMIENPSTWYYVVVKADSFTGGGSFELQAIRETGSNSKLFSWRKSGQTYNYMPATITSVSSHNTGIFAMNFSEGL